MGSYIIVILLALSATIGCYGKVLNHECVTNTDCPQDLSFCCDIGYCASRPSECHDGQCASDSDCHPGECCSQWGYCGSNSDYCAITTPKSTTTKKECDSLADCPASRPWCCDGGVCAEYPSDCGDGECKADADCQADAPCCSEWGYCGNDPEYCLWGCPKEQGFCVKADQGDQNAGVIKKNNLDGDTVEAQEKCLELCKQTDGATGCEVIWDQNNRGCYVHTQEIARGNGVDKHLCWVFSKCRDTSLSVLL